MDSLCLLRGLALPFLLLPTQLLWAADSSQKHTLKSQHQPNELTRVEVALQVGGDLKLVTDGKDKVLPMSVVANLKYDEMLLATDEADRPSRTVRYYDDTRAVIKVDKGGEKPALHNEHRLIVVEKPEQSAAVLYCPSAKLNREELDLIDVPGNTLLVDQLLPTVPVSLGEPWKLADQTLADLLGLEAVSWSDVQSVLGEVTSGIADIATAGSVSGAVGGISTEIELKAKYKFDVRLKRIVYLAILIKEKRAVGHVGPGLDTVAKVIMSIQPIVKSQHLTGEMLSIARQKMTPESSQLSYKAPGSGFGFTYDRRWFVTSDDPKLAVLRLVDRGELMAQCNVSALPGSHSKPVSLAEFQRDVQESLGKNFGQFVTAGQSINDAGDTVLRVVVRGIVSDLPIEWVYYLIANDKGQRVSLAFTYEQELTERFAQADRILVSQLQLTAPQQPTAARSTPQATKAK